MTLEETIEMSVKIVADAIREAGSIPSGYLYSSLMQFGITLDEYNILIGILKRSGRVEEKFHELKWIEPKGGSNGSVN